MADNSFSLIRRSFRQLDLAFWCIHEHPVSLLILTLPALVASGLLATVIAAVIKTWDLPWFYNAILYVIIYPTVAFWIFTFTPLPCVVFAWRRAEGLVLAPGECFQFVNQRIGRLVPVVLRCGFYYFFWFILAGIPFLFLWPRTCLAPMVALFENDKKIFQRSRRLLNQESAIHLLAVLHLCLAVALGLLVFVPRILIKSELLESQWAVSLANSLWAFELPAGAIVVCGLSVSWSLSLTLLYYEIRQLREGESVRLRIKELQRKFGTAAAVLS